MAVGKSQGSLLGESPRHFSDTARTVPKSSSFVCKSGVITARPAPTYNSLGRGGGESSPANETLRKSGVFGGTPKNVSCGETLTIPSI